MIHPVLSPPPSSILSFPSSFMADILDDFIHPVPSFPSPLAKHHPFSTCFFRPSRTDHRAREATWQSIKEFTPQYPGPISPKDASWHGSMEKHVAISIPGRPALSRAPSASMFDEEVQMMCWQETAELHF
jgi:hypothetical protein